MATITGNDIRVQSECLCGEPLHSYLDDDGTVVTFCWCCTTFSPNDPPAPEPATCRWCGSPTHSDLPDIDGAYCFDCGKTVPTSENRS